MVIVVASVLIAINIYCGFGKPGGIHSWPFAAFPHFAVVFRQPVKTSMHIVLLDEHQKEIDIDQDKLSEEFSSSRYWGLLSNIMAEPDPIEMVKKIMALLEVSSRSEPKVKNAKILKIFLRLNSTLPEQRGADPVAEKLILNINLVH